jgi:pimeloyl-ACP methyl ester carboxylesterase
VVEDPFVAPALRYLVLEHRCFAESVVLRVARPLLSRPAVDPHGVLVLPGLGSTDRSTRSLRTVLRQQHHWVHGWQQGRHKVWTREMIAHVEERLRELHERHGAPVSLIGISAGGILARELAREHPERVRQVITVVSPFRHRDGDDNRIARLLSRIKPGDDDHFGMLPREEERSRLPVPVTAIYSRSDGLVDWRSCVETPGTERDNIEIRTSHFGAASNIGTAIAVSDRLNCPVGDWRPFRAPRGTAVLFPRRRDRAGAR